ncbi:metallophosphoesterase [Virgibacillus sp. JSM 102003]|uniref:metallophosphoesterase n=1 Tax=Virgibacillus sp. JSM 102003 TaxID=1562108 RepID=UPI0035C09F90
MLSLVISDIHGCLDEFEKLLQVIHYRPNHDQLILLGVYIDRGPKSKEVVQLIKKLTEPYHCVKEKS